MSKINYSPEFIQKLQELEDKKPENKMMALMASLVTAITVMSEVKDAAGGSETAKELLAALKELSSKTAALIEKPDPSFPTNDKLEKEMKNFREDIAASIEELSTAISKQKLSPVVRVSVPDINVPTPQVDVNVAAPNLKRLEEIFSNTIEAIGSSIASIDIPSVDLASLHEKFDKMIAVLSDIDTGVRIKPAPGTMKVTNPDGTNIGGGSGGTTGVYNSTPPTVADGASESLQIGSRGSMKVQLSLPNSATDVAFSAGGDGQANPSVASRFETISRGTVFNGTSWDRQRGDATNGTLVDLGANNDVTVLPTAIAQSTGTLTLAAQTVSANVTSAGGVSLKVYGTYASAVLIFEASLDGTNWAPIQGQRSDTNISEAQTDALTNATVIWDFPATGITNIRVRCVSITSGTVNVAIAPTAMSLEPTPTATVMSGEKDITGLSAGSLNADLVASLDVRGYKSAYLQITGTFVGTLTFQGSNDGTTFVSAVGYSVGGNTAVSSTNNVAQVEIPIRFRFLRVRMTAYTSGTATGLLRLSTQTPAALPVTSAVQSGTWTVDTELAAAAAQADAQANPTTAPVAGFNSLFNGTTWDRQRNNVNTTTGDTGAKTATFNGATQTNHNARGAIITIVMGTVTGTTPTFIPQLQYSDDGGTTWVNLGPAMTTISASGTHILVVYPSNTSQAAGATPANLTTGAASTTVVNAPLPRTWRLTYTIGGTSPSFTMTRVGVNYII